MSEQPQAMSRERWPLLEAVNMIGMLSYLGTSPLAERQVTIDMSIFHGCNPCCHYTYIH